MKTYATKHAHVRQHDNGVTVLKPHGDLMGGEETDELEKLIDEFDAARVPCLVVNLVDVGMMNSLSIGRLVGGHLKFKKRSASMHLCNVDAKLINVFVITKLSMEFNVFASEDAAVQGWKEKPEAGAP